MRVTFSFFLSPFSLLSFDLLDCRFRRVLCEGAGRVGGKGAQGLQRALVLAGGEDADGGALNKLLLVVEHRHQRVMYPGIPGREGFQGACGL